MADVAEFAAALARVAGGGTALDPEVVSQLLARASQRDPLDRRRHVVSITPEGKRELARIRRVFQQLEDEFFAPFDDETRAAFHELLIRLAEQNDPSCVFSA